MNYKISDNMSITSESITDVNYVSNIYTKPKLLNVVEKQDTIEVTYSREFLHKDYNNPFTKPQVFTIIYGRYDGSKREITF